MNKRACDAQEKYCYEKNLPHFAPSDGRCYSCSHDIYSGERGYSVEKAGSQLITACPYCHSSYCD